MATSPLASGNPATILDDDNWPIWSIRTEGLLVEAGLWSVVEDGVTPLPTAPAPNATQEERAAYAADLARSRADSTLDRKARAFLQRHVSNLHIFTVKHANSAQDAWETLESRIVSRATVATPAATQPPAHGIRRVSSALLCASAAAANRAGSLQLPFSTSQLAALPGDQGPGTPAPLQQGTIHFECTFAAVRSPDNRGHQGISQAVFDFIRHHYHERSKPSPSCKDQRSYWVCLTTGDDTCTLVKETRRFFESSLLVMWREFDEEQQHLEEQWRQNQRQQGGQLQQPPSMRVSLSTFVRLRPPWVARLTASQRQVCVCKTCCNLDNLLTALAHHKKSLQLPPAAAIAAPLAAPLAAVGAAPQPPPHQGGDAPPVAEEEDNSLTAATSPYIDPLGDFEQQEHRWQAEQERQPWQAAPPFHPSPLPPFPPSPLPPPLYTPLYTPGLPPVPLHSPPPLPPHSPILIPPPPSKTQPLSATAMRQLFLCPCELGQQPGLACSLRTCPHCKSRKLHLQPDADGSVMLTVRQYGKPASAVGSRPAPAAGKAKVELLCMRVSLSDVVGMLNKQMPEYIRHHRLAHHQLQVFREHREAVKAGQDGKVVISCDWSEKLTVERSIEIMSEHWHAQQIGILVACAYFKNKEGAYKEHTVYVMTDGKEQSAAITQAAVNQVVCYLLAEHDMDMRQLYMWSDGCAGQFKGAPAMRQHWGMAQRFSMPVWWSYGATAHFKGRHDSEGGVVKQWLRGEILADRVGKCNALGFVQHCNAYHKPAAAADPSKAHRARASVGHRWCLELSTREVELCNAPEWDAHAFASSIPGSMSMHSCFFPAAGIHVEWSETACACAQCMTPAPRGVCMRPTITKPFVAMPMFDQKRDDKHWDDECLTLLCSFAPDSVKQLCTLGKKLSVKMLNEYCKAVGLYVPANTLRADLRAEPFACLADCRSPWVPAARARRRKRDAKIRRHIMSECFTFDRDQRNRMKTLFSNPVRPSSPGRRPSPSRSSSPARTSNPSRGRAQTPGRAAAQSPSRGASLFTYSTAAADDDDDDLDDVLMQMVQPRLNFNSDLYSPFCIDSGASQHILKDLQFFYNYTAFAPDKHRPVKLAAAGHNVWAVGSGSVFLSTKRGSWFLSHALYVPDSKQNFISVAAATDEGSSFLFRGDLCQISSNQFGSMLRVNAHKIRNSYILAAVPMPDGPDTDSEHEQGAKLYNIKQSALQPDHRVQLEPLTNVAAPSANSATSNSPQVWHQRLCHASYDALARMQSEGMVSGVPITAAQFRAAASYPAVCVGCVKGKQHKNVAFAGPSPNAAPVTAPLGLIHMDVCGPMHASARDGSLYVTTFLDEHTKLSVCMPISSKAQVPDIVRTVIEELETQSGFRCKAIRTDNGTEYVNSHMKEYCRSKGIVHQHSAPYSPQQNGAAERLNRTIFEKARSIIHSADISLSFWAHAVKFANHVRCLLPVSGQPLTPWEAFYGVKPDLSGLRRSKLQAKSVEGLFLGYEPGSKAYRVLVNGRETCSKDIVFDELSVLQPTRQQDQAAQPVFLLPLPPSPVYPSEPLTLVAPAEGGNGLQQTSSSSSEDSGSSSSISRPGSSAQRPRSRPLEGIGAHQDSSSSDSPPSEQEPRRQWEQDQQHQLQHQQHQQQHQQHQQQQDQQHQLQHQQHQQQHQQQQDEQHQLQHQQQHDQQQQDQQHQLQHQQQQDQQHQPQHPQQPDLQHHQEHQLIRQPELNAMTVSDSPINDTPTVAEALAGPMADLWIEAMNAELAPCMQTKHGNIEKLKARLVAKGFYQQSGVDVGDVYAPVSKHTTLRTLLAKAAAEDMEIHQLDFETAFLNGKLEPGEVIYVQQPEGFEEGITNTVCRQQKALYGLRQAPRAWHARLCEELLSMGFKASEADPALFTLQLSTGMVYLLVYVDDCLVCTQQGDTAGLAYVKKQLSSAFKLKDLGEARWFLGMQLTRDRAEGTIMLDQHKCIQELVTANSKSAAHSKPLPMAPAVKLVREGDALDTTLHHYSALVGSLLYLTCCTRPDIAFVGTADQGLLFGGVSGLQGFSDADYAGDKDTARSTTGYIFTLNGGAISWSSRLQPTVAMSTAEAEYMAASSAAKEALWLRKLMRDLQLDASCVHLGCDNQAAIQLLHNPMATSRAKHIDVHHHFVRERISRGEVAFHYCHTSSMLADILTKPLAAVQFNMGKQGCGVFS
ncbi:hypothetical protein QJQ45_005911 [Haematococcus lacustris]|nr:hypothetical protein QJQ45_005911 [Haematococcus lacustris]